MKDKRLTDLYADLVVQDKKLKELKAKKQHGEDVDGLLEADVRKDFLGMCCVIPSVLMKGSYNGFYIFHTIQNFLNIISVLR